MSTIKLSAFVLVLLAFLVNGCTAPPPTTIRQAPVSTATTVPPRPEPSPTNIPPTVKAVEKISMPGKYQGYSQILYDEYVKTSQYITVRDGTKLAADIYRPAKQGVAVDIPYPVIWKLTRYERGADEAPYPWLMQVLKHGYVLAAVESRGSQASFGTMTGDFTPEQVKDAYDVTEWLAAQPWSDGNIGMYGMGGSVATQVMAAGGKPPHLKAVFPINGWFDFYSVAYQNGIFFKVVRGYGEQLMEGGSYGQPVGQPVDEDKDGSMLNAARQEHKANRDIGPLVESMPYRDSREPGSSELFYTLHNPSADLDGIRDSSVAVYQWDGWFDLFILQSLLWYKNLNVPQKLVIGAWNTWGFGSPDSPSYLDYNVEYLRWYDYWLKGIDNGIMDEPPIYYFTMGPAEKQGWHTSEQWPLPNQALTNYYFGAGPSGSVQSNNDGSLNLTMSVSTTDKDTYVVDYTTSSGTTIRWGDLEGETYYDSQYNLNSNDEKGLTYTTPPLTSEIEVTGHPIIHLWVSSTAKDGDFFAYLEDVDENGDSHYITDGKLRASHRALSTAPHDNIGLPYHRSFAEDIVDLPDEPVELIFDLLPTSYIFDTGHCIRVTITCADDNLFMTPRLDPVPTVTVYRNASYPSYIVLPIIPRQ